MKITRITKTTGKKLQNGTLPDIDTDFPGDSRAEIKDFMAKRFGEKQICSVGTAATMKLKGAIKDFARYVGLDFQEANLITSIIDGLADVSMEDLFKRAPQEPKLKNFLKKNSDLIYMLPDILNQPKTQSIHACAIIVFPDVMEAHEWVPVRKQKGLTVSGWDGYELDDAGFLKDDILGIVQLDKFTEIIDLIKENGKEAPDIYNIPYDDEEVYRYFQNGWCGDVFQIGSSGMQEFSKVLRPTELADLTATVALYRPGPMENHYHTMYAQCKNGEREPEPLPGTEAHTDDTYGLLVYQEQIMKICQDVGGLTEQEADEVRAALGKKKLKVLEKWSGPIKNGFISKGYTEQDFQNVWDAMVEFAKYSFNLAHAAAYGITAYICQYLKVHYPIEFWTVALGYVDASDPKMLTYLSEIFATGKLQVLPPSVNNSHSLMFSDQESNTIYWGISNVKGIGEITAQGILDERDKNGRFKHLMDFMDRCLVKGSKVNKTAIESLIACGAFDDIANKTIKKAHKKGMMTFLDGSPYYLDSPETISTGIKRQMMVSLYRAEKKVKIANPGRDWFINGSTTEDYWWKLQEKRLTGLMLLNYMDLKKNIGLEGMMFNEPNLSGIQRVNNKVFGGYVVELKERRSAKGQFAIITIENNYKQFTVMIWADQWKELSDNKPSAGDIMMFRADSVYNEKFKAKQFVFSDKSEMLLLK